MAAYKHIVILTGAGISQESGIRTFRAADGLWEEHSIDDVATPEGFARDPQLVHQFYNTRRAQLLSGDIEPNAAHQALAKLEQEYPGEVLVITQNIDDLHERAGQKDLIHMHGELLKMRCSVTGQLYDIHGDITGSSSCECCGLTETLRPHVVWFGEIPLEMDRIYRHLAHCDLFLSIGTSGNVYPAAGFVREAKQAGATAYELNLEPSETNYDFDQHIYGLATQTVPQLVDDLLSQD